MPNTTAISVEQAAAQLADLVHSLGADDEIVLTENNTPVASLRPSFTGRPRRPGSCKGMLTVVREDDDHLSGFAEYLR